MVDDFEVSIKMSEVLNLEQPCDCDEFCDELSELRCEIKEGIEKYLKDNNKLVEIEY
ncbi:TPA: hypothetical protein ACG3IY_001230 [Clostridioides difficile]